MFKKSLSLLLLLFFTKTVLAGIDLHHGSINDNSFDIVEHYIDAHSSYNGAGHQCSVDLEKVSNTSIVNADVDKTSQVETDFHQHGCHGHTTYYSFTNTSFLNIIFATHHSHFNYILSENSIILNTTYRPPITS